MRRRSHLFVAFVALVTVGWNVVTTQPGGSALAADPQAELHRTRAQLADARTAQQVLSATLERQRSELAALERRSNDLGSALDLARAELAAVTAEYDRVRGLLVQVREQVTADRAAPRRAERPDRGAHREAGPRRGGDRAAHRRADGARGPPRGAPPIRLRAQPDVAPRDHPLGRLARRGHRPVRLPHHRVRPGCGPGRRDPLHPRGARDPSRSRSARVAAWWLTRARSPARKQRQLEGSPGRADRARGAAGRAPGRRPVEAGGAGVGPQCVARRGGKRRAQDRRERACGAGRRQPGRPAPAAGRRAGRRHRGGPAPCGRGGRSAGRGRSGGAGEPDLVVRLPLAGALIPRDAGVGTDELPARAAIHLQGHLLPAFPCRHRLRRRLRDADLRDGSGRRGRLRPAADAVGLRIWRGRRPRRRHPELVLAHAAERRRRARARS